MSCKKVNINPKIYGRYMLAKYNKYIYHITYTENLKEIKVNYKNNYVYLLSDRCFYSDIFKRIGFINNNIKMSKNDF